MGRLVNVMRPSVTAHWPLMKLKVPILPQRWRDRGTVFLGDFKHLTFHSDRSQIFEKDILRL